MPEPDAPSFYTRMYCALQQFEGTDFDLFRDSMANWEEMKRGFEFLAKAHPSSLWQANNYAAFACRAQDRKAYEDARPRFGPYQMSGAWPSNLSLEICDRRFLRPA